MAVLQSTNVQGSLCVNGVAVGGGKDFKYCCFTGSSTWTPTQDLVDGDGFVQATLVAGGGGGGGACAYNSGPQCNTSWGAGGGGGEVIPEKIIDITATSACTVTIGAGGTAGVSTGTISGADCEGGPGGKGGNTEFGGKTAYGGGGGPGVWHATYPAVSRINCDNIAGGPPAGACVCGGSGANWGTFSNCCLGWPNGASGNWKEMFNMSAMGGVQQHTDCYKLANCMWIGGSFSVSGSYGNAEKSGSVMCAHTNNQAHGYGWGEEGFGRGGVSGMCYHAWNLPGGVRCNAHNFGAGGRGAFTCNQSAHQGRSAGGNAGNEGIVILKWAE